MTTPAISVVVPSHARHLRLRWLLNSLEEQTLAADRFEVIVVHDYDDGVTATTLDRHGLAADGRLRHFRIEPGTGSPARQRNIGWRAARAEVVAFVDDDCRADPGWLEAYLAAAERHPGAIVQGVTKTEPYEYETWGAPHVRTLDIPHPPNEFFQTCNILYPRALLEALDGFDESFKRPAGEDTDLACRALDAGAAVEGDYAPVVYHAVEEYSLPAMVRMSWKWRDIVAVAVRHPHLRDQGDWALGIFWKKSHWQLLLALAGLVSAKRVRPAALAAAPYLASKLRRRGSERRQVAVAALELPGQAVVDAAEVAAMVAGSIENRRLVL